MDWLRDAYDTFDILLTYGDTRDPLFSRILSNYRDLARDCGRADELERIVQRVLDRADRPQLNAPAAER